MKRSTIIRICWACSAACVLALTLLLSGCVADPLPKMARNSAQILVVENPNLPANVLGTYKWFGNMCVIYLREYPTCMAHEVRHCLEGDWHGDRVSNRDCF